MSTRGEEQFGCFGARGSFSLPTDPTHRPRRALGFLFLSSLPTVQVKELEAVEVPQARGQLAR